MLLADSEELVAWLQHWVSVLPHAFILQPEFLLQLLTYAAVTTDILASKAVVTLAFVCLQQLLHQPMTTFCIWKNNNACTVPTISAPGDVMSNLWLLLLFQTLLLLLHYYYHRCTNNSETAFSLGASTTYFTTFSPTQKSSAAVLCVVL